MIIEFAAAYYEMNRFQASLEKALETNDQDEIKSAREGFALAGRARDALEDRCLQDLVYANPMKEGGYYVALQFQWPPGRESRPRIHVQKFTAEFSF